MTGARVAVEGLLRTYRSRGGQEVPALRGLDLAVAPGELLVLRGRSGSGKTTLLNCLGGLDRPDGGRVRVDDVDLGGLDERGRAELRRTRVGFVFQSFGLLPVLSAAENVALPLRLLRTPARERDARVELLLALVGLTGAAPQRPGELSGGQQQRVAVARALANRPGLLLADEPTGQLDSQTGRAVLELLRAVVDGEGVTTVVATHDPTVAEIADRVLEIRDGTVAAGS